MLDRINDLPAGVVGVRASAMITGEDYERVMIPLLDEARREGRRVKFLYELSSQYEGLTTGGVVEDARVGLRYLRLFDACAVVGDVAWIREAIRFTAPLMPCPVRAFSLAERSDAIAWLVSSRGPAVSYRIVPEPGVLVVEVSSALRAEDFDALSVAADEWIETHGELHGIVIHAREFPGWENLASVMRHVRFVRDHQRKVRRVALAAGGHMASIAPRLAEHFVQAEIRHFDFDALDQAIAWAKA
jgi:hypothetical protein